MPNYANSLLLDFQTRAGGVFSELEMRDKKSQLLSLFMKNPTAVIPNYEALKTSDQRAGSVKLLNRTITAVGTNRSATHTGAFGDSTTTPLTWKTYQLPFKVSVKQGDRNIFENQARFDNSLRNAILDIHAEIDTDLNAFLASDKTQVAETTVAKATWDAATFAYKVSLANKDDYFQILKSIMRKNGYKGALDLVSDSYKRMDGEKIFANGSQNAVNTAWMSSGLTHFEDHNLVDGAFAQGLSYAIPEGAVTVLPWINPLNDKGAGSEDGVTGVFTKLKDPLGSGLDFHVHYKKGLADTQAVGGEYQDIVTEFEISLDLAIVTAPMSTANESAIVKFGQLAIQYDTS